MGNIIDYYWDATPNSLMALWTQFPDGSGRTGVFQVIEASEECYLGKIQFYLNKYSTPSGLLRAALYALTGTPGVDAKPSGDPLAKSTTYAIENLTSTLQLIDFIFPGGPTCHLDAGYHPVLVYIEDDSGVTTSKYPQVGLNQNGGGHAGNAGSRYNNLWYAWATRDAIFYCWKPVKLHPFWWFLRPSVVTYWEEPCNEYPHGWTGNTGSWALDSDRKEGAYSWDALYTGALWREITKSIAGFPTMTKYDYYINFWLKAVQFNQQTTDRVNGRLDIWGSTKAALIEFTAVLGESPQEHFVINWYKDGYRNSITNQLDLNKWYRIGIHNDHTNNLVTGYVDGIAHLSTPYPLEEKPLTAKQRILGAIGQTEEWKIDNIQLEDSLD